MRRRPLIGFRLSLPFAAGAQQPEANQVRMRQNGVVIAAAGPAQTAALRRAGS
jgi:hypothetical protein